MESGDNLQEIFHKGMEDVLPYPKERCQYSMPMASLWRKRNAMETAIISPLPTSDNSQTEKSDQKLVPPPRNNTFPPALTNWLSAYI
jgi:hypothetical protein